MNKKSINYHTESIWKVSQTLALYGFRRFRRRTGCKFTNKIHRPENIYCRVVLDWDRTMRTILIESRFFANIKYRQKSNFRERAMRTIGGGGVRF